MRSHRVLVVLLFLSSVSVFAAGDPVPPTGWGVPATAVNAAGKPQSSGIPSPAIPDQEKVATAAQPWELFQESKLDATWLPGSNSNGLGITDVEFGSTQSFSLFPGSTPLKITPYAAAHFWSEPARSGRLPALDLPSNLYDLSIEFAWRPRLVEWLFADLAVTPGLYTDFKDVRGDSFMMRGRALAIVAFSPQFQVVAGGMYVNRNKTKFLPAGGLIWNPSEDTHCFLVFPQPKVSHRFTTIGDTQLWGYVAGEFGGGRWEIERANGEADSIDYTDLRVILGVETVHAQHLTGHIDIGYVFGRRVNFSSNTPDYEPDNTVMLRAGLRY